MSSDLLKEANTLEAVATTFRRSLEEIRLEGRERGRAEGREEGIERGIKQGIERGQVKVLRELAARKFGSATAEELVRAIGDAGDPARVARATDALLDCDTAADFVNRVREG